MRKNGLNSPIKILICFLPNNWLKTCEMVSPISKRGCFNLLEKKWYFYTAPLVPISTQTGLLPSATSGPTWNPRRHQLESTLSIQVEIKLTVTSCLFVFHVRCSAYTASYPEHNVDYKQQSIFKTAFSSFLPSKIKYNSKKRDFHRTSRRDPILTTRCLFNTDLSVWTVVSHARNIPSWQHPHRIKVLKIAH